MQIPKSFRLGRKEWAVRPKAVPARGAHIYGQVYPSYGTIVIRYANRQQAPRSETFWHEVTHAILYDMGDPRWNDEKFVTAFSKRLNQVINTAKL
jgi:hypothetical protein